MTIPHSHSERGIFYLSLSPPFSVLRHANGACQKDSRIALHSFNFLFRKTRYFGNVMNGIAFGFHATGILTISFGFTFSKSFYTPFSKSFSTTFCTPLPQPFVQSRRHDAVVIPILLLALEVLALISK